MKRVKLNPRTGTSLTLALALTLALTLTLTLTPPPHSATKFQRLHNQELFVYSLVCDSNAIESSSCLSSRKRWAA
ncbi:hypothetical protein G9A89_021632 [Geosiphon pyriformis]|nr:hypothetical protein G9A89_021632 [Geosiphon pyriformis]